MEPITQEHPLLNRFDYLTARPSLDCSAYNCPPERLVELLQSLRDKLGYNFLTDVTAIDNGVEASPRFTCVYHLYNLETHEYIRVCADCSDNERPSIASVAHLFPTADWHERETYDMLGIVFEGHPDLRRILMWEGYPYFPLRKEFPLAGIETDFPSEEIAETTGVRVRPAPMMGGPFHADVGRPMSESEPRAKDESWTEKRGKGNAED